MIQEEKEKWIKNRLKCVTGTDIAGILGISPWTTPFKIWQSKVDPQDLPDDSNDAMRWGNRLEPVIADVYMNECGAKALVKGEFISKDFDGLPAGGTPDYLRPDSRIVLEVKTSRRQDGWGEQGTDDIPMYYLTQVIWYMGILGWEMAHVAVLIGGYDLRTYNVPMDRELFVALLNRAREFWMFVSSKTPPQIDGSESCRYWLSRQYKGSGVLVDPSTDLAVNISTLRDVSNSIHKLEYEKAVLQNKIISLMGDFDRTRIQGIGKISIVRGTETSSTDWKAVCDAAGVSNELVARYTTKSQKRSYIKPTWEKE